MGLQSLNTPRGGAPRTPPARQSAVAARRADVYPALLDARAVEKWIEPDSLSAGWRSSLVKLPALVASG